MDEDYREFEAKTVDEAIVTAMRPSGRISKISRFRSFLRGPRDCSASWAQSPRRFLRARQEGRKHKAVGRYRRQGPKLPRKSHAPEQQTISREDMENACRVVTEILKHMNIPSEVRIGKDNIIEVVGDGSGLLIGKRGQTLDSCSSSRTGS